MTKEEETLFAWLLTNAPKSVKVGPHEVSVEIVDGWAKFDDKEAFGGWNGNFHRIVLSSVSPTPTHLVGVLIHEIFHAIFSIYDLRKKNPKQIDEESFVTSLELGWLGVFVDNPMFLEWIQKGLAMPKKTPTKAPSKVVKTPAKAAKKTTKKSPKKSKTGY